MATVALVFHGAAACRPGRPCGTVLRVSVRRSMTDLPSLAPAESQEFYRRVLGLEPVLDRGWIVSLADPVRPGVRLSLFSHDQSAPLLRAVCSSRSTTWRPAYAASSPATRTVRSSTC
jgi:catechol 2,3-dioxygenase-like lactoylglutathione lyase family enzyme